MLSIGGITCNFIPISPHFQHWGDEARPLLFSRKQIKRRPKKGLQGKFEEFLSPKLREDQKKTFSPKIEEFLFPKASKDQKKSPKIIQRSDADHSQIIGGIYPPQVSAPLFSTI